MSVELPCPCGVLLRVPDATRPVRCPQCQKVIYPRAADVPPPPQAPKVRSGDAVPVAKARPYQPPPPPPAAPPVPEPDTDDATPYGLTADRRSAEQNADRDRMNALVNKAKRRKEQEERDEPADDEDDEEEEDDRPRRRSIGVFEGTYYNSPRLFAFIMSTFMFLLFGTFFIIIVKQPVPRARDVVGIGGAVIITGFMVFDILRGGGRNTHWWI